MPYKKGPNNTLRYYDSHTGRYASSYSIYLKDSIPKKMKLSVDEKEQLRRKNLASRAMHSKDKYVYDLFLAIKNKNPGCVILINSQIFHKGLKRTREIDIVTKKCIIEVKSGKVKHRLSQFLKQIDLAREIGKEHYLYAPDITKRKCLELKSKGIKAFTNKEELIKEIK